MVKLSISLPFFLFSVATAIPLDTQLEGCVDNSFLWSYKLNDPVWQNLGDSFFNQKYNLKSILDSTAFPGVYYDLAREWLTASLNQKNGATLPETSRKAQHASYLLLKDNVKQTSVITLESAVTSSGKSYKLADLLQTLTDYNNGVNKDSSPPTCASKAQSIHVLHTNDIHSHFEQFNKYGTDCTADQITKNQCFGGVARITSLVNTLRKKYENSILVDAGDQFQGTLFFNTYGGSIIANWMNDIKYDLLSVGNHEFDRGVHYLSGFLKSLDFHKVSANIEKAHIPELVEAGLKPYAIFPQYKLAVIGFITNTTGDITNVKNVTFYNPVISVQKQIDELHSKGIKRIICVSHNGYSEDLYLAKNTRGISLIVGGHSHSLLTKFALPGAVGSYPSPTQNLDNTTTYVVQAHRYGDYLGDVEVRFDENDNLTFLDGNPILLDQTISVDERTAKQVADWKQVFEAETKAVVGAVKEDLLNSQCQGGECLLGNLLANSWLEWSQTLSDKGHISLVNVGGLRASLVKGNVTVANVMAVLPFGDSIVQFKATGSSLWQTVQNTVNGVNPDGTKVISLPRFVGLKYTYQASDKVLKSIEIQVDGIWSPIDLNKQYNVIATEFVANGGDNIFRPAPTNGINTGMKVDDIAIQYFKKYGTVDVSLVGSINVV
ncbi:hypothetical protein HK099_005111 [Clydaea vesicula]|uniref:5'-nucleotidase n=1 Tax=Clydaea vesicula TaxID=447962 RepID=A0AAD5U0R5_9FUNG|nr:hypothetical protein HK099_005111 [Clydaea vesicula]KAJ3397105.1 hypothetical protein HDU92_000805 [Lobulomyces angularis]